METRATEETIKKYFIALNLLHSILKNTKNISMMKFSETNQLSKGLSTVLSKGGIIRNTKKGRYGEWEWISIYPTREMAIKTIKMLSEINPERKTTSKPTRKYKKRVKTYLKGHTTRYLFGLIKINTVYNYEIVK